MLVCVTLNAPNDWNDHSELLDYGFSTYKDKKVSKKGVKATTFTYDKKNDRKVNLLFSENFSIAVTGKDTVTTDIEYVNFKAPQKKGTTAAYLNVYCNDKKIKSVPLITEKEIKKIGFFSHLVAKIRSLFLLIFRL